MSTPVIAFFNSKGGVGKTSLVYHLAWMYADLGWKVIVADLDPQANLTSAFLDEDRLEELWFDNNHPHTIYGSILPLWQGADDITEPHVEEVDEGFLQPTLFGSPIGLLVGDLRLSLFEDELSEAWFKYLEEHPRTFQITSAFWRIMQKAATSHHANIILMDTAPNLSAINRAALIAADYVIMPLFPDVFSLQGLYISGPILRKWSAEWNDRLARNTTSDLSLPIGSMQPLGYIVLQHALRMDRPVQAYDRWITHIPQDYQKYVLGNPTTDTMASSHDPKRLALLKHYHSLMPIAQEAHKPMFHLKPADGAIGAQMQAVQGTYLDFEKLAREIAKRVNIPLP